jgi:hypothetical protein
MMAFRVVVAAALAWNQGGGHGARRAGIAGEPQREVAEW